MCRFLIYVHVFWCSQYRYGIPVQRIQHPNFLECDMQCVSISFHEMARCTWLLFKIRTRERPRYHISIHWTKLELLGLQSSVLCSWCTFLLNQIWDCQKMKCVATLQGHVDAVNVVFSCPEFPVLITGSVDGSIRLWNSSTFRYAPRPPSYKSTYCIRL